MRILSGKFKGRSLVSFSDKGIRPTLGVVKSAVFNMCAQDIQGETFLDVFAGSGSMGFEALSRGASEVTFVDSSKKAIKIIKENARFLQVERESIILQKDVLVAFRQLGDEGRKFSVVYMDPPYNLPDEFLKKVLQGLVDSDILTSFSRIFLEKAGEKELVVNGLITKRQRRFGGSFLFEFSR